MYTLQTDLNFSFNSKWFIARITLKLVICNIFGFVHGDCSMYQGMPLEVEDVDMLMTQKQGPICQYYK